MNSNTLCMCTVVCGGTQTAALNRRRGRRRYLRIRGNPPSRYRRYDFRISNYCVSLDNGEGEEEDHIVTGSTFKNKTDNKTEIKSTTNSTSTSVIFIFSTHIGTTTAFTATIHCENNNNNNYYYYYFVTIAKKNKFWRSPSIIEKKQEKEEDAQITSIKTTRTKWPLTSSSSSSSSSSCLSYLIIIIILTLHRNGRKNVNIIQIPIIGSAEEVASRARVSVSPLPLPPPAKGRTSEEEEEERKDLLPLLLFLGALLLLLLLLLSLLLLLLSLSSSLLLLLDKSILLLSLLSSPSPSHAVTIKVFNDRRWSRSRLKKKILLKIPPVEKDRFSQEQRWLLLSVVVVQSLTSSSSLSRAPRLASSKAAAPSSLTSSFPLGSSYLFVLLLLLLFDGCWNPRQFLRTSTTTTTTAPLATGGGGKDYHDHHNNNTNINNNKTKTFLCPVFKLLDLASSSSSSSSKHRPYHHHQIVPCFITSATFTLLLIITIIIIAIPALKKKNKRTIIIIIIIITDYKNNNNNKHHYASEGILLLFYHYWLWSIGMPRPLDDEFSYEPPGKKNRSSDSTDNTGSSTTSIRKDASALKMPKSPRGNQKAASTDVPTIFPKSEIRRAQFKGSKSMPAIDASSPEPMFASPKEAEKIASEMSSTGRPAETTNLHLKYLLQVTDSELQNMSREVPTSQTMSMGVPSTGKPLANTQLVLAPVTSSQPSENLIFPEIIKIPVSEKGVEKYHVKSDSLEQQGLKLVYTKPTAENQEARPMNYVALKPHSQILSTEKTLPQQQQQQQQQQSMTGDSAVGRKRKHPQKQGRHICQYCGRGWAKPSVLEKHIRAHTNERPFPCANCGLSFKTKSNLSKHTKSRTHALKAGLSQRASSTSSETAGTEGDVDAKDTNESEETQTETSETDGENEDDPQKVKNDFLPMQDAHTRLMRGNSEPSTRTCLQDFKEKNLKSNEGLLLSDRSLSATTVATAGGSGYCESTASSMPRESSDVFPCRMFGGTSKSQRAEVSYLQQSTTSNAPVYLSEKKFFIRKLPESKLSSSFEGTWDDSPHSISETMVTPTTATITATTTSCLLKENTTKYTKSQSLEAKPSSTSSKDSVSQSISSWSFSNKVPSFGTIPSQEQPSAKDGDETKPVSSFILSGAPTPSTKEMVKKRITQLISDNDLLVNTPMKEPPRQKRVLRQISDPPTSHSSKLDDLPPCSSMSKVSIPSIASIPLTPIPGDTDQRRDTSNSPKPFLVSDKYNVQNVVNLTGKSQVSSLTAPSSKVDPLSEKISSGRHSNGHEIKIEIKLSKVAPMSNLVTTTTANVAQTVVGQPNIQYLSAAPVMTTVNKNPGNSVIKGLLMKGKSASAALGSSSNVKAIKEKSSSVDDISKFKNEASSISPFLQSETRTASGRDFLVGSKSSQLHKMHLCRSGPAATNTDPQTVFEPESQHDQSEKAKLDKSNSLERESVSGSLSLSLSSDRESSNDYDIERGFKDEKTDPLSSSFESCDLTIPKKKGRPKGSKNKPKITPNSTNLQLSYQPTTSINTSSQQTSILLSTLKKKSLVSQTTFVSTTTTTVSSSMVGQPMVSAQNSWTQPSSMITNPLSTTPSTPTKLMLKGKILLKRSMSTEIPQERESETVSTIPSTGSNTSARENSSNHALLWASALEGTKQPSDLDQNQRNSPLKKRKVRTCEASNTVIRPSVTRAGSEPLMSRMGQSWSGSSSMKLFAEKRLSSLPETLEYQLSKTSSGTSAPDIPAPVKVPVVLAEPVEVPMMFFDSFQSSAVRKSSLPIRPSHSSSLAVLMNTTQKQDKETPTVPGLVSFLLQNDFKCESLEESFDHKDLKESLSTVAEGMSSIKTLQPLDSIGVSSRSSYLVQGSSCSSPSVRPGALTKPTDINLIRQHLYGHSVNSLRGLTHTTLCCVQQVQPMYVAQGDNNKISMYSNWKLPEANQDSDDLTNRMLISLYNSKTSSDPIFVVSSAKSCQLNLVDSCKWSLYNKPKAWFSSSYSIEKISNGLISIFITKSESSKLDSKLPSEDKDISHASGGSMESTTSSLGGKDIQGGKQPKRVRIFQGGFRSNEEYIYIRGRGRGKYVCEECGIRCKKPSMLKKHIRTHTNLRPYHCRHCCLSFKTKGNLTKHMKSKAHQKKCLELNIDPVPVTVDESQIDSVALAAQSAIAKDTRILDDDNEDDEEDDKDLDDEEETDDADGQFSDSEESARTSFERMDTSETIDTSVDKESECGTPAQTSSIDVAETCRMPEVHSCELPEAEALTGAEATKTITSNSVTSYCPEPVSLQTVSTSNMPHRQGTSSQLQFVNEIAHSLLDLAQRQIPHADESPPHLLDTTDSVIFTTTTTTSTATTLTTSTTITSTTTTAVSVQSKAEVSEKTLKRQYSFDMDDSPERGYNRSPIQQVEMPDIQGQLGNEHLQKTHLLQQTSSEEVAMINQQTPTAAAAIVENFCHKEMMEGKRDKRGSQLLSHPSMVALKMDSSQKDFQRTPLAAAAAAAAVTIDQPLAHSICLIQDPSNNLQNTPEENSSLYLVNNNNNNKSSPFTSTLPLTPSQLPHIGQLIKGESGVHPSISADPVSHFQSITPFQFEHPFQDFHRSPHDRNNNNNEEEESKRVTKTVIIPLATSTALESTFLCSPQTVRSSQSLSRESSSMEVMVHNSEAVTSSHQEQQILLPSQQAPNNQSIVSIIVSNQAFRNVENLGQQPQLEQKQQPHLVSNSPYSGLTNIPQVVTPSQPFGGNIIVEPQLIENLIPEQPQQRQAESQPVSLILEKPATENKLLITRQSPSSFAEKPFPSEQRSAVFERQSPKHYIDNSQTRPTSGQTRVHVERRIPMLEVQPMIPNVQLPPQEDGKLSLAQRLESLSPTRQYVGQLSPKQQHMERLSPTRLQVDSFSPMRLQVDRLSPTRQQLDRLSPTRRQVDRLSPTRQQLDRLSPTRRQVDRLSPTRRQMDRLSPTRQQVSQLSSARQHVERLSPTRHHIERLSPACQHLSPTRQPMDVLSSTLHRVDTLSPTRQSIRELSPTKPHLDTSSPSQHHVDTISSHHAVDMLSPLKQTMADKQMERLSPSKKLTGDRISPTRHQAIDHLSPMRGVSPTNQRMDRLTTFRLYQEKLLSNRSYSSQSPTQMTDKLSPTRLTDKPPFKRQANRLSPSRHTEGISSMRQHDRVSPTRPMERISPSRYENPSPTRSPARLSPCRREQQLSSEQQFALQVDEGQPSNQVLDAQPMIHKGSEKELPSELLEGQVSTVISTNNQNKVAQTSIERSSPYKDSGSCSSQPLTLQKSFKEDLNKCHICNKCFSNAKDYMEHRRQHMKTQTHHSQDSSSSCGHSRPHLHKCFHSEGHADSRSMSTEEIPRPPDCENCKMDFWKQNHLPKHLWAKKHRLTLMRNKNSSSTDSESAAPSEAVPDTVVTPVSGCPSRVQTILGTEKALDLSIDEPVNIASLSSTCITSTHVTTVSTTTAVTSLTPITTTAVVAMLPNDIISHETSHMIAETQCIQREPAAILTTDITDQASFFIPQGTPTKKYVDSSCEELKEETIETEILRSSNRNPEYYVLTGDEGEISGTSVIPITQLTPHTTHVCHLCPRTFTTPYELENHLSHVDPRPFVCEYCDAGFPKKQSLHIHLQMHTQQEKPYICGFCGDTFVTSESLKQHSLSHVSMESHRSFDEPVLHPYQQGTRISGQLTKPYDRGVLSSTSQLCSQDLYSSFSSMISAPVQVSALNIQSKQPQYRLPSSQAQQYIEINSYSSRDSGPVMVKSTLPAEINTYSSRDSGPVMVKSTLPAATLALDTVVSKP